MSYSTELSSAFNDTRMRSRYLSPQSGMCSFCTEECDGSCEIALAAVLGARTVYPTNTGNNQVASEKDYPVDFSHFNINGRVFGAEGTGAKYENSSIWHVNLEQEYGRYNKVKLALPILLPALIKLNWEDYFAGAAMAGVSAVIGESARDKDPNLKIEKGKITEFRLLKPMLDAFRKYYRNYGQIILQCNVEDDLLGLPEYAIKEHGLIALEFKFGQAAKGTQPARKLKNRQDALDKLAKGILVFPDPMDPEIINADENGCAPNFYSYDRLPLWDEDYMLSRINRLRELGLKNVYFKMAGYDLKDIERLMDLAGKAEIDMITFDGAGGGSGYSPNKMMNEWGLPTIMLEDAVCRYAKKLEDKKGWVPAITITGGFSSEDQVFKALAYGDGRVKAIGLCRAGMAAAMTGKKIGDLLKEGRLPAHFKKYGSTKEELFGDLPDLRAIYGKKVDEFSAGAVGVFSYLNKIAFGIKHFAALNRKFKLSLLNKSDLLALTPDARYIIEGKWFNK